MIKKILVNFCLLLSLSALAQEGTSSPYSYYGIGDIKFKGAIENRSMGGVSIFPDSTHINLQNPAQLASLKRTTFAVGATHSNNKIKTETQSEKNSRTTYDYLAIGIPTGKLSIGFGLLPYSSVGYKIQPPSTTSTQKQYTGSGGINKVFLSAAYPVLKNLNIGTNVQYNFGAITTSLAESQDNIQNGTRKTDLSRAHGFTVDFGLNHKAKLSKNHTLFSSITYTPESQLSLSNSSTLEVINFSNSGATITMESTDLPAVNSTIKLPSKYSIGLGFGETKKWLIGAEITSIKNSVLTNRFPSANASFENTTRYSIGGYYIPQYNSFTNYYKRITYRSGLRYENTGLVIQNQSIKDMAVNVGASLPVGSGFSSATIGLEFGKRGTKNSGLIEENYFNLSIGLSFSDKWFEKRKYN